ncbi:PSP1 domain-containing protein [Rudanella paleaurantiibacter]|nr:regulatory iron-sulfur-containing complex subunit RicT [Rudanella paleaurantiibacter]
MSCKSCTTGGCGSRTAVAADGSAVKGCGSGGCSTGGCNKLNSFDWLSDMAQPDAKSDVVEVKFKGGRKEYYRNVHQLDLTTGDYVVVEMPSGYHMGAVSMQGELVRLQLKRKNVKVNDDMKVIQRIANQRDLEKHEQAINRDLPTMYRAREIIRELKLNMKLSDVEYQSDNTKATFYYSSEERVDFRELIKALAGEFKIRVEMRQISLRQEAGRLGGIGSCGRELCCSTWLTDFKNITTSAARYQNLSLNPAKLSGQCGRLKCCLNYELDTYVDALRDIPTIDKPLETQKGRAFLQKTDIFRKIMWFGYSSESTWHPLAIKRVLEIVELNKKGVIPESFDVLTPVGEKEAIPVNELNSDLDQLDKKYAIKTGGKKKKKKKPPVKK